MNLIRCLFGGRIMAHHGKRTLIGSTCSQLGPTIPACGEPRLQCRCLRYLPSSSAVQATCNCYTSTSLQYQTRRDSTNQLRSWPRIRESMGMSTKLVFVTDLNRKRQERQSASNFSRLRRRLLETNLSCHVHGAQMGLYALLNSLVKALVLSALGLVSFTTQ